MPVDRDALEALLVKIDTEGMAGALIDYPNLFADVGLGPPATAAARALAKLSDAITVAVDDHPDLRDTLWY